MFSHHPKFYLKSQNHFSIIIILSLDFYKSKINSPHQESNIL